MKGTAADAEQAAVEGVVVSNDRQDLVDANNALYGENQELRRQHAAGARAYRELQEAYQRLQQELVDTAKNLNGKLTEARASPEARFERIKHQNNEMRVMMNRLHRHLSSGKLEAAIAEWTHCNNWLSLNNIEPYTGPVPGYPSPTLAAD